MIQTYVKKIPEVSSIHSPVVMYRITDVINLIHHYFFIICWGVKLIAHLHLMSRLIMCGALSALPQYIFMMWCLLKQWIRLHGALLS